MIGVLAGLAVAFFLFFAVTVVAGALSTAAAVAATVQQYQEINGSLPNAAQVSADVFQTTRILDRNGVLLQEIADQDYGWRTFVPFEKISPYLIDATIASEDATFWSHEGVEPYAIARGAIIIAGGEGSSGGSTITQQLVRSVHPEAIGTEVSIQRKWREGLAAVALERQFSKHDILTMYLNQIFYGNRSYGIEAAAQTYFHKSAAELNLAEASLLAGIPQQPTNFNPALYPENAHRRQKYVLDQMVKLGYITRAEANEAYANWPTVYPARDGDGAVLDHPHFVEYVKLYLAETYPDKDFTKGGFNIYTTIDTALQDRAEEIVAQNVQNQLQYYRAQNAALTIVVPWSGEILAMVGSADFNNAAIEGQVNITTSAAATGVGHQAGRLRRGLRAGLAPRHRGSRRADQDRDAGRDRSGDRRGGALLRAPELPAHLQRRRHGAHGPGQLTQYPGGEGRRVRGGSRGDRRHGSAHGDQARALAAARRLRTLDCSRLGRRLAAGADQRLRHDRQHGEICPGHADSEDHRQRGQRPL